VKGRDTEGEGWVSEKGVGGGERLGGGVGDWRRRREGGRLGRERECGGVGGAEGVEPEGRD